MNKPLNPTIHGFLDYILAAFLFFAPAMFGFTGVAATIFYIAAFAHLAMSLVTAYPLGVFKKLPFTIHGKIEIAAAIFLIVAPWLFGFSEFDVARNTYVIVGAGLAVVWALTNYRAARMGTSYKLPESGDRMAA